MKKKLFLISFILLIIFVVLSFIPVTYKLVSYEYIGFGGYVEEWSLLQSYADSITSGGFDAIISGLCLLSAIVGIVVLILQYNGKQSNILRKLTISPTISALAYLVTTMYNILPKEAPHSYSPVGYLGISAGWGFYVEAALIIAATVMSIKILKIEPENSSANEEN